MSDENLGEVLDEGWRAHKREVIVRKLGERGHLTLEKLAKLVAHKDHGEILKDITLQELLDEQLKGAPPKGAGPKGGKKVTKKVPKKKPAQKPVAKTSPKTEAAKKKVAKKKAAKKTAKKTASKGPKADKGRPKPRLDYDTGCREVLACIKAAGGPLGRQDIEKATGYTGVQVRTFAKKLSAADKITILGTGGRSTRYAIPG